MQWLFFSSYDYGIYTGYGPKKQVEVQVLPTLGLF